MKEFECDVKVVTTFKAKVWASCPQDAKERLEKTKAEYNLLTLSDAEFEGVSLNQMVGRPRAIK